MEEQGIAVNRQQAHYHPNLDEPCAHDSPPWQDLEPTRPITVGDWFATGIAAVLLLIVGVEALLVLWLVQP